MFNHKVEIQIPKYSCLGGMEKINIMKAFALLFGGVSCIDLQGLWMDSNGNYHTDYSWLVYSHSSVPVDRLMIVDMARGIATRLNQACVMIVINNVAEFIGSEGVTTI